VHKRLLVENINTHGLLYTWQGSNAELKPTVLLAHQDTVPVPSDTIAAWEYPPVRPLHPLPHFPHTNLFAHEQSKYLHIVVEWCL
jgi:hypothetical protein